MKHVLSARKAIEAFMNEIEMFRLFIGRANPRKPIADVTMADFDDPYWEPMLNWRGRLLGMERLLLAVGVDADDLAKIKSDPDAGLPEDFRKLRPHNNLC